MKVLFKTCRAPGVASEQIAALRREEAAAVWTLLACGFLREIYLAPEGPAVIGVVEAESVDHARARLRSLPMPAAGLIDFELHSLQPYDQFSLLFEEPAN